jgi:hypothetical protein
LPKQEEISGRRIRRFHACKGKRPGAGHRFVMIGSLCSTLREQVHPVLLINLLVDRQRGARRFQVGSGLIKRERQSSRFLAHLDGQFTLLGWHRAQ